jgi:hypothetical protein
MCSKGPFRNQPSPNRNHNRTCNAGNEAVYVVFVPIPEASSVNSRIKRSNKRAFVLDHRSIIGLTATCFIKIIPGSGFLMTDSASECSYAVIASSRLPFLVKNTKGVLLCQLRDVTSLASLRPPSMPWPRSESTFRRARSAFRNLCQLSKLS